MKEGIKRKVMWRNEMKEEIMKNYADVKYTINLNATIR